MAPDARTRPRDATRWLAVLGALGAWSILPPYVGPAVGLELDVPSRVELVDHVVPGAAVVALSGAALLAVRGGTDAGDGLAVLAAACLCFLAGVWETASHIPLLADAGDPGAPWGAVLLHLTPGPALSALSLWLVLRGG